MVSGCELSPGLQQTGPPGPVRPDWTVCVFNLGQRQGRALRDFLLTLQQPIGQSLTNFSTNRDIRKSSSSSSCHYCYFSVRGVKECRPQNQAEPNTTRHSRDAKQMKAGPKETRTKQETQTETDPGQGKNWGQYIQNKPSRTKQSQAEPNAARQSRQAKQSWQDQQGLKEQGGSKRGIKRSSWSCREANTAVQVQQNQQTPTGQDKTGQGRAVQG